MIRALTIREFFHKTYLPLRLAGSKPATEVQYTVALNHLRRHAGRDVSVWELSDELISGCMAAIILRGSSAATANKTRAHLLSLWRYAKRKGLVDDLPDVDRLKQPKRIPKAWPVDDLSRILQSARQETGVICQVVAWKWWVGLILVMYDTGLRISPTMALRWADFDEDQRMVFVPAEHQKQNQDQLPALSDDSITGLRAIRSDRELIFPWPFDQKTPQWPALNRRLRKILVRAGLPAGPKDLFHKLRKTNASYIELGGGDPTSQLGHSSRQVTDAYLDPRICRRKRQVDLLPRPTMPTVDPQLRLF